MQGDKSDSYEEKEQALRESTSRILESIIIKRESKYVTVDQLETNVPYAIIDGERTATQYGDSVKVSLHRNNSYFQCHVAKDYMEIFNDERRAAIRKKVLNLELKYFGTTDDQMKQHHYTITEVSGCKRININSGNAEEGEPPKKNQQ